MKKLILILALISTVAYAGIDYIIQNKDQDKDIIVKINDGGTSTEVMRIDGSSSNVGINETTPANKLHVSETATNSYIARFESNQASNAGIMLRDSSAAADAKNKFIRSSSGNFEIGGDVDAENSKSVGFRIKSNGIIEMGTQTPTTPNDVVIASNDGGVGLSLQDLGSTSSILEFGDASDGNIGQIRYIHTSDQMEFRVNDSTRMTIDSNGYVGIAEATPLTPLHVYRSGVGGLTAVTVELNSGSSNGTDFISFERGASQIGRVEQSSTTTVSYQTSSDKRLKKNYRDFEAIPLVKNIEAIKYNWKDNDDEDIGFLAQDLYKVYPYAVSVGGDDENKNPWMVEYGKLTPLLLKAIQEQQKVIEDLKSRLEALEK